MLCALLFLLTSSAVEADVASDSWIAYRTKMLLLLNPEIDATQLHVDSTNRRVTLFGSVASTDGRNAATRIASQVVGVRSVRDLLTVVPRAALPAQAVDDESLWRKVDEVLRDDAALAESGVRVESVTAGTVILGGRASSLTEQYRAVRLARGVAGVKRVASVIDGPQLLKDTELWSGAPRARGDAAADARLINAVKVRLVADPLVPALDVSVDAVDGNVVLFGVVPSEDAKREAERAARSVPDVRSLRNELFVRRAADAPAASSGNDDLRAVVARAIDGAADLDDADIVVSLRGEQVQLSGRVTSQDDRLTALTVARSAAGAHGVVDALVVAPAPIPARDHGG